MKQLTDEDVSRSRYMMRCIDECGKLLDELGYAEDEASLVDRYNLALSYKMM